MSYSRFDRLVDSVFDDFGLGFPMRATSYTVRGQFVDTDKFDIVPKAGYIDEQIKLKEAQLKKLTEEHETRVKAIEEELSSLKGQKKALKSG